MLSLYISIVLDVFVVAAFAYAGTLVAWKLYERQPDLTIENAHLRAKHLYVVIAMGVPVFALIARKEYFRRIYWNLPYWVDYYFHSFPMWTILGIFGYLFGFATALAYKSGFERKAMLVRISVIFTLTILGLHVAQVYPAYASIGVKTDKYGNILQSSGVSCAAASGANIAKFYNNTVTEKEMAGLMGTYYFMGTSDSYIHYGMAKIGLDCQRRTSANSDITEIAPPAILFIDDSSAGPEGHAVAFMEMKEKAVIIDPLLGVRRLGNAELSKAWHGKAMECVKKASERQT